MSRHDQFYRLPGGIPERMKYRVNQLVRQSQIVQSVMHSSDAVLMTQFLYNPLLVCTDLASQLRILMRHNLSSVYVDVCIFIHSPRITYN